MTTPRERIAIIKQYRKSWNKPDIKFTGTAVKLLLDELDRYRGLLQRAIDPLAGFASHCQYKHSTLIDTDEEAAKAYRDLKLSTLRLVEEAEYAIEDKPLLVCVLCGEPWLPGVKNRCECGGMCSWGEVKGGKPISWKVNEDGSWTPNQPPKDLQA